MIRLVLITIASLSYFFSIVIPVDYTIWNTFFKEILVFIAAFFTFSVLLSFKKVTLPVALIPIFLISLIPIFQWVFGLIYFSTTAILCSLYLMSFGLMVFTGYNYNLNYNYKNILTWFCFLLVFLSVLSSLFAFYQWLNFKNNSVPIIMMLYGSRPFANFGQPNHLAIFLFIGLISCFYLFERGFLNKIVLLLISFILIFGLALTQSRTPLVIGILIFFLMWYKKNNLNISFKLEKVFIVAIILFYILVLFNLEQLNFFIKSLFQLNIVDTTPIVNRLFSDRLDIWMQSFYAIKQNPIVGWGWFQTSFAQLGTTHIYQYHGIYTSSHNILFDILIWNGCILGGLICCYGIWFLLDLFYNAKSFESLISFFMALAIILYAMLEFPLYYSYFLLPVGFLLGLVKAEQKVGSVFLVRKSIIFFVLIIFIFILSCVWREYISTFYKLSESQEIELNRIIQDQPVHNKQKKIIFLEDFKFLSIIKYKIEWIAFNPFTCVSDNDIFKYQNIVYSYPTHLNLYKYAQLLAYNKKNKQAKRQLYLISVIYGKKHEFNDLLKKDIYIVNSQ